MMYRTNKISITPKIFMAISYFASCTASVFFLRWSFTALTFRI